jgi:REP element-mobilizing transposase RayT
MATDNDDLPPRAIQHVAAAPTPGVRKEMPGAHRRTHKTIRDACADLVTELVEFRSEADHARLVVGYSPTQAIPVPVQPIKGRSA